MSLQSKDRKFVKVTTPNPEEFAFKVKVDMNQIGADELVGKLNTAYSTFNFSKNLKPDYEGWLSYVLTSVKDGDERHLWLYFSKAKTTEEKNTPFNEFPDWRTAEWHNVLIDVPEFVKDTNFLIASPYENNSTVLVPRWYARRKYLPGGNYRCKHTIRQYLSPTAFTEAELAGTQEPIPTEIHIELPGLEFYVPKSLHPEVTAPDLNTGVVVAQEDGLSQPKGGSRFEGQIFPATNVKRWTRRILNEQQQTETGQYFREEVIIDPPEGVKVQRF